LRRLGEILVESGRVPPSALAEALREQRERRRPLGEVLLSRNLLSRQDLLKCLSEQLQVASCDPSLAALDPALIEALPYDIASRHKAIAVGRDGPYVVCAMSDPLNVLALDELESRFGCRVAPRIALPDDIDKAIDRAYGRQGAAITSAGKSQTQPGADGGASPSVAFVNRMMIEALRREASDIHVEPERGAAVMRYRVDGVLRVFPAPAPDLLPAIVARVKVLAELDLSESRLPQDGRFSFRDGGVEVDVRVATIPTMHGEKLVMRLLPPRNTMRRLESLGLFPEDLAIVRRLARTPYGLIAVTGPAGSGKTTTLYGILDELNTADKHILTVEDPVEIDIPGIRQVQVNRRAGLTFATALRSFLRADPNIIMVGEIRDKETLEIALQAALTGHLVVSTLHTNDAPGAIARMLDMGAPPFMVATTLVGVIAQRLVRRICPECKAPAAADDPSRMLLGLPANVVSHVGKGCVPCGNSGYRGRVGLYEVLTARDGRLDRSSDPLSDPLKSFYKIKPRQTLRDQALARMVAGETSAAEVVRVTF